MEEVLFEVYDQGYECAYLERSIDSELAAVLGHQDSRRHVGGASSAAVKPWKWNRDGR
jgi:hypothetical protein